MKLWRLKMIHILMDCITTLKFGAQVGDNQKILIKFGAQLHFQTDEDKVDPNFQKTLRVLHPVPIYRLLVQRYK